MEEIAWVPGEIKRELWLSLVKLRVLTYLFRGLSLFSFLYSFCYMGARSEFAGPLSALTGLIFGLFMLQQLKVLLDYSSHRAELLQREQETISNESLRLLAEIEIELDRGV